MKNIFPVRIEIKYIIIILSLSFLVYSNSLQNEFIWDDIELIEENTLIRSFKNLPEIFTTHYWDIGKALPIEGNYRPLTITSYLLNYYATGLSPAGFRVVNISLHAINAALVYVLASLIGIGGVYAFLCGAIFAVHPIHTEAVVWIVGRSEVMACTFLLVSLISNIYYHNRNRKWLLFASLLLYIAALLTKESAASLPFIIFIYRLIFFSGDWYKRAFSALVSTLPYIALTLFYLLLRLSFIGMVGDKDTVFFVGYSSFQIFLTMVKVVAFYWWLLIFPVNLRAHYDLIDFPVPLSVLGTDFLLSLSVHIFIASTLAVLFLKKRFTLFFSLIWVYIALLPYMQIIRFQWLMAERFLYIPSIGFSLLLARFVEGFLAQWIKRPAFKRLILAPSITCMIVFFSVITLFRNQDWRDEVVFFRKMISQEPDLANAHGGLGAALSKRGKIDDAIEAYKKALEFRPDYHEARQQLRYLKTIKEISAPPRREKN